MTKKGERLSTWRCNSGVVETSIGCLFSPDRLAPLGPHDEGVKCQDIELPVRSYV